MNKKFRFNLLMTIAALGVVFGDLGTSPLYVLNTAFSKIGLGIKINQLTIYGVSSLIIWSLIIVVSIQFVLYIMNTVWDGLLYLSYQSLQ